MFKFNLKRDYWNFKHSSDFTKILISLFGPEGGIEYE